MCTESDDFRESSPSSKFPQVCVFREICRPLSLFPHLVFFTDIVQLEAPRMGPDSAEHLEILEEFGPGAASSTLQCRTDTCSEGDV